MARPAAVAPDASGADSDALLAEVERLRSDNARLRSELRTAVDASLQCFAHFGGVVALAEKYALMVGDRQTAEDEAESARYSALVATLNQVLQPLRSDTAAPVQQQAPAPLGFTPRTPPRPQGGLEQRVAPSTPVTPGYATRVLVHESPAVEPRVLIHDSPAAETRAALPVTPLKPDDCRRRAPRHLPTKLLRRLQLEPDDWADRGQEADREVLGLSPAPPCTLPGRLEPMLRAGRIYKVHVPTSTPGMSEVGFYNATLDMQFTLEYEFGDGDCVEACGPWVSRAGGTMAVTVGPGESRRFVRGLLNGYKLSVQYGYATEAVLRDDELRAAAAARAAVEAVSGLCADQGQPTSAAAALCAHFGVQFVDPEFPPCRSSIGGPDDVSARPWKRQDGGSLYGGEPAEVAVDPSDVESGQLGDNWLTNGITAAAEWPHLVEALFAGSPNAGGTYTVRLCASGWWATVVLDDWLPSAGLCPSFCRSLSRPRVLWPSLLQKAFAKVHGSYASLRGAGHVAESLADLTGCAAEPFDWTGGQPDSTLWEKLVEWCRSGFVVVLTTPPADDDDQADLVQQYQANGMVLGRSYVVLRAEAAAGGLRLLQVRNAFGDSGRWSGDWRDSSPLWLSAPHLKHQCGFNGGGDGTMWMQWEEAVAVYTGGAVCYTLPASVSGDVRVRVSFDAEGRPGVCCAVSGAGACRLIAALQQQDSRADPATTYSAFCVFVVEPVGESAWTIAASSHNGAYWRARDVVCTTPLVPKERPYYVIPRMYRSDHPVTAVLSVAMDSPSATIQFVTPSPSMLEAMMYEPIYDFVPSTQPAASQVQICGADSVRTAAATLSRSVTVQT